MNYYNQIIQGIVNSIFFLGYLGIFILMFLESSFFPFPSEIVLIPAGYLASQKKLNIYLIIFFGILGSIFGALFNYYLANKFGRKIILKFLKEHHLKKVEKYFKKHGHISTFNGRLIPVVRQYISFPAGLAKMNLKKFIIFTGLGAGIWVTILTLIGYYIGENQKLIHKYLTQITVITLTAIILLSLIYIIIIKNKEIKK